MGATAITFDDLVSISPVQGTIPATYHNLSWTGASFLNATQHPTSGYPLVVGSGSFVAWFNGQMKIKTLKSNQTIGLNSFIIAAGWSDSVIVTIDGYYSNTQLNSTTLTLNTSSRKTPVFNWYGLNKIVFTPSGPGYLDTGIDNLCVTF